MVTSIFMLSNAPFKLPSDDSSDTSPSENLSKSDPFQPLKSLKFPRILYVDDLKELEKPLLIYKFNLIPGGIIKLNEYSSNYRDLLTRNIDLTSYKILMASTNEIAPNIKTNALNQNAEILQVNPIWDLGYHGEGAVVAVIDTGIDFNHPGLIGKKVDEMSFVSTDFGYDNNEDATDQFGHGTSVSSLIVGNDANFPEYRGMGYEADLVNAKIGSSSGIITSAGLIAAIDWAGNKPEVDIINISLGEPEEGPATDLLEKIANAAVRNGKIVIGSAGNSGKQGASHSDHFTIGSPSSAIEAISVGAIDYSSNLFGATSEGPTMGWEFKPDFVGPGSGVNVAKVSSDYSSCTAFSCYRSLSGTSFSTPLISGVFALGISALKSNNLLISPGLLKSVAHRSTIDLGYMWNLQGSGLINASLFVSNLLNDNIKSAVIPGSLPFHKLANLPAGESLSMPLTMVGPSIDFWTISMTTGNASSFVYIDPAASILGYSQILNIIISPPKDLVPGIYKATVEMQSPNNELLLFNIEINIIPPAKYRLLLDLVHTPWDSYVGSNIATRLERKLGHDTQDLIDILIENGIWVNELLNGEITPELLENYDLIWMPSVFVDPEPVIIDREPIRSQKITREELFALYHFKESGGSFLIDFGGNSINDNFFDLLNSDLSSLVSLLSLFGIRASDGNGGAISNTETIPSFQLGSNQFSTIAGEITLNNGIPVAKLDESANSMVAFLGSNGEKAFISNNRNWRDEIRMNDVSEFGSRAFAKELVKWLIKDEVIDNITVNLEDKVLEIQGEINSASINEDELDIRIWKNGIELTVNSIELLPNGHFKGVLNENIIGIFDVEISYINETITFTKEIDLHGPQIEVETRIPSDQNSKTETISWNIEISDDGVIPEKNILLSSENRDDWNYIEVTNTLLGFSIEVLKSNLKNLDAILSIEVIDVLGNYHKKIFEISERAVSDANSTEGNSRKKDSVINFEYFILGLLILQLITYKKITKSRKAKI